MSALSPILWKNHDATITIIDVPLSIASAQNLLLDDCVDRHLLSTEPLQQAFPTHEPKTAKKSASIGNHAADEKVHDEYHHILKSALESIAQEYHGVWCHPRQYQVQAAQKRKRDNSSDVSPGELPGCKLSSISSILRNYASFTEANIVTFGSLVTNCSKQSVSVSLENREFHIPPQSSFVLGDCADSSTFHTCIRNQAQEQDTERRFDLVLLDPPWPNRSVKRSHMTPGSTYATIRDLDGMYELMMSMDLDIIMAGNCLVGVWITNKPAVREFVLGTDGVFAAWGVDLIEEWLWLKTTTSGEPVSAIDSLWRKPYEVLLLGRRRTTAAQNLPTTAASNAVLRRRVLMGVPDVHSRKPCLKVLLEPMLGNGDSYRALEVFSRHLVAGWWSWGNECIKFNCSKHWVDCVT